MFARRFVKADRKTFDLALEGIREDVIRISENGKRRRITMTLGMEESRWLVETWQQMWRNGCSNGWFRRRKTGIGTLLFQIQQNRWGRIVVVSEITDRGSKFIIIPEGYNQTGWRDFSSSFTYLVDLTTKPRRTNVMPQRELESRNPAVRIPRFQTASTLAAVKESDPPVMLNNQVKMEGCCPHCGENFEGVAGFTLRRVIGGPRAGSMGRKFNVVGAGKVPGGHESENIALMETSAQGQGFRRDNPSSEVGGCRRTGGRNLEPVEEVSMVEETVDSVQEIRSQRSRELTANHNFEFQTDGPDEGYGLDDGPGRVPYCFKETVFQHNNSPLSLHDEERERVQGRLSSSIRVDRVSETPDAEAHSQRSSYSNQERRRGSSRLRSRNTTVDSPLPLKPLRVYKRRNGNGNQKQAGLKGILFTEKPMEVKRFSSSEWVEKLKGVQREESTSSAEMTGNSIHHIASGECSRWVDAQPEDSVPCIDRSLGGGMRRNSPLGFAAVDFTSPSVSSIEDYASRWVLDNVGAISKAIGLSCQGKDSEVMKLFEAIESKRLQEGRKDSAVKHPKRTSRELRNLTCTVNYDGKDMGNGVRASRVVRSNRGHKSYVK